MTKIVRGDRVRMFAFQLVLLGSVLMFTQGCSVYVAARKPGPCYVEKVQVGSTLGEVRAVLGAPKSTETINGDRVDLYEFTDGYVQASKLRIILYVGGDVFTLCLTELIFWPLELATLKGEEGRATVTFDANSVVKTLYVTQRNGKPWVYRDRSEKKKPPEEVPKETPEAERAANSSKQQ